MQRRPDHAQGPGQYPLASSGREWKIRFPSLDLALLPVELVCCLLQCSLRAGILHFSAANQDHAFDRHGSGFLACLPHVVATIADPHFIGQSPHHPTEFEMVRATCDDAHMHVLVAVAFGADHTYRYAVRSVYPIGYATVSRRLRKKHLFRVPETAKALPWRQGLIEA